MQWVELRDLNGHKRWLNTEHIVQLVFDERGVIVYTTVGQFGINQEEYAMLERKLSQFASEPIA